MRAKRTQVPLRLAYGLTIHRARLRVRVYCMLTDAGCQGMQLDHVDLSFNGIFEAGQAYVALSRVRTLEGLYLTDFQPQRIHAHPAALRFYDTPSEEDGSPVTDDDTVASDGGVAPDVLQCWRNTLPERLATTLGI